MRRRLALGLAAAVACTAAPPPSPGSPPPTRALEGRVSAPGADVWRPHVPPSSTSAGSFARLRGLEDRGETRELIAELLSRGDVLRSRELLSHLPESPGRASDEAALALLERDPGRALSFAEEAITRDPALVPAHWNRALALAGLGLPLAAARELDRVAEKREPGWADEARDRAAALRAAETARRTPLVELEEAARAMLVSDGAAIVDPARIDVAPATVRAHFYEAVRLAESPARLAALRPLAARLDALEGGQVLTALLDTAGRSDWPRRTALARAYRAWRADPTLPTPALRREAARFPDVEMGFLRLEEAGGTPRYQALARATGDRWFALDALAARLARLHETDPAAGLDLEEEALRALETCDRALAEPCVDIAVGLSTIYTEVERLPEMTALARRALELARSSGARGWEVYALHGYAQVALLSGETPLWVARYEELLEQPDLACELRGDALTAIASARYDAGRVEEARGWLMAPDPCPPMADPTRAYLLGQIARNHGRPGDREAVRSASARLREARPGEGDLGPLADDLDARLLRAEDPGAARAQARALIARLGPATRTQIEVVARASAFAMLLDDAAERDAWGEVWTLFGEERRVAPPARCAVAVASDDLDGLVVVRGSRGIDGGKRFVVEPSRVADASDVNGEGIFDPELRPLLLGCEAISVWARPPFEGIPDVLPPDLAWSFAAEGRPRAPLPGKGTYLVVREPRTPPGLGLPRLGHWPLPADPERVVLEGAAATPARALAELARADFAVFHTHGVVDLAVSDASFLALSPGADGSYLLTAAALGRARFPRAPVVLLAACRSGETAPAFNRAWSLPRAFLKAGARAVVAATRPIPDDEGGRFFDAVAGRLRAGQGVAAAVRDERRLWLARDPRTWVRSVVLFE